jgi:hypothetical protein
MADPGAVSGALFSAQAAVDLAALASRAPARSPPAAAHHEKSAMPWPTSLAVFICAWILTLVLLPLLRVFFFARRHDSSKSDAAL